MSKINAIKVLKMSYFALKHMCSRGFLMEECTSHRNILAHIFYTNRALIMCKNKMNFILNFKTLREFLRFISHFSLSLSFLFFLFQCVPSSIFPSANLLLVIFKRLIFSHILFPLPLSLLHSTFPPLSPPHFLPSLNCFVSFSDSSTFHGRWLRAA